MILKGNQRGNGRELANHLMHGKENEHVELHDLRGFAAEDLHGAMQEAEAIAKRTRCKNHLFSLSLNPPQDEQVSVERFESAISRIEGEFGLEGQPRAIVFHEKEGRRHCHAVWSRIDGDQMKAIKLDFYKRTLNGIARDLCERSGLDFYIQTQLMLCAASDPAQIALWSEVWDYVQTLEGAGWNDRLFVVIEPDEDALEVLWTCTLAGFQYARTRLCPTDHKSNL